MITLHQFPNGKGLPNASPFCMKLESYLKAMNLPYEIVTGFDPRKSPTGKIPYVTIDKQVTADSGLIIQKLEAESDHPMQGILNPEQKAETCAIMRLMEEHLYWVIVYSRWIDETGFAIWKNEFQKATGLPSLIFSFLIKKIRKDVEKQLHGQGLGRHTQEQVYQMGNEDIDALSMLLSDKEFFYQDQPTLLDHCLYAHTQSIIKMSWDYPLKQHTLNKDNLMAHSERMMARFFPEHCQDVVKDAE